METVFVAAFFDVAVFLEGIGVETAAFHGQRVVDDELHRHDRIDLGRVAALVGDGITQAGQVDQRSLAQDVVADHAGREPGKVALALALDELHEALVDDGRVGLAHDVFGVHTGRVRQAGPGARLDGFHRGTGIEVVERGAGQVLAKLAVHFWLSLQIIRSWFDRLTTNG